MEFVVAVLDTGADYRHTDLAPNLWENQAELNGESAASMTTATVTSMTFAAGILSATTRIPWMVSFMARMSRARLSQFRTTARALPVLCTAGKVMVLKVLDDNGSGVLSDAVDAIEYARGKRRAGIE